MHVPAASIFHLKRQALDQALAATIFHLNRHAYRQARAARIRRRNRRYLAPERFHCITIPSGWLIQPSIFSTN
jgi:hypothetical protein